MRARFAIPAVMAAGLILTACTSGAPPVAASAPTSSPVASAGPSPVATPSSAAPAPSSTPSTSAPKPLPEARDVGIPRIVAAPALAACPYATTLKATLHVGVSGLVHYRWTFTDGAPGPAGTVYVRAGHDVVVTTKRTVLATGGHFTAYLRVGDRSSDAAAPSCQAPAGDGGT
jgi:hypothetical protein